MWVALNEQCLCGAYPLGVCDQLYFNDSAILYSVPAKAATAYKFVYAFSGPVHPVHANTLGTKYNTG